MMVPIWSVARTWVMLLMLLTLAACGNTLSIGVEQPTATSSPSEDSAEVRDISGVVRSIDTSARSITLEQDKQGRLTIAIHEATQIRWKDGAPASLEELMEGTQVRVSGKRSADTVAADEVVIVGGVLRPVGAIGGRLWHDDCANQATDGPAPQGCLEIVRAEGRALEANAIFEDGEQGIADVVVELGERPCPSAGADTTHTDADGRFSFENLEPGSYCVTINPQHTHNAPLLLPGAWTYPTRNRQQASIDVTLGHSEQKLDVLAGWDYQFLPEPQVAAGATPEVSEQCGEITSTKGGRPDALVKGPSGFCAVWEDTYPDETGFRIELNFGGNGRFIYEVEPNMTEFLIPEEAQPFSSSHGECARDDFSVTIFALRPTGEVIVNGMAIDSECRPENVPDAQPTDDPRIGPRTVNWGELVIALPSDAEWRTDPAPEEVIPGVRGIAAGSVIYPKAETPVEKPFGPAFASYRFSGSIDEWIEGAQQAAPQGNPIVESSIRDLTIAGLAAKAYQHTVTGVGQSEYYVLKVSDDTLILIYVEDRESEPYRTVIENLRLQQ